MHKKFWNIFHLKKGSVIMVHFSCLIADSVPTVMCPAVLLGNFLKFVNVFQSCFKFGHLSRHLFEGFAFLDTLQMKFLACVSK